MIKLDESKLAKLKTADQLLDEEYGKEGTLSRAEFHEKAMAWYYGEILRDRRKEFEQDIPAIYDMLKQGCGKAREAAAATLDEVRRAMKINYFDDAELIAEQARRFRGE